MRTCLPFLNDQQVPPHCPSLHWIPGKWGVWLLWLMWLPSLLLAGDGSDLPGGKALQPKPSQYGPFRNDPAQGIPKHAFAPFDKLNQPPERLLLEGRDFLKGRVVVKLKSPAASRTKAASAVPDTMALHQKFAGHGVTSLDRVFPNAQPPVAQAKAVGGAQAPEKPDLTRWLRAKCADQEDISALVKKLAEDPDVEYVEPDMIRRPAGLPSAATDPLFAQQWHLPAAHIPEAWAYLDSLGLPPGGNRDIVVAVIDTGVDYNHPDLAANMWTNSREIPGNNIDDDGNGFKDDVHGVRVEGTHSGNPMDDHGHGTHVAGIIGAQAGNSNGVVGVAYNVQIMAIKAAQYSGVLAASDIAEGINYAVANGADIINMSFGGYAKSQIEEDALAVAFGQCVLVAAAGNDAKVNQPCPFGADMYPAAYNWVLGVMASKPGGGLAPFSNFDCTPHDTHEYELMAPGVDIWSTLPNNQYAAWDGTSMAAPIVSGIAALVRTKFPDKDTYSSRFIMGQIAANAGSGANALAALTVAPTPELSFQELWLFDTSLQATNNDNDGRVDAGETIDLAIVIRNHWGKASNVVVTLDAWADGAFQPDPYVIWLTNIVDYGAIGAFNWDDNGLIYSNQVVTGVRYPFRFQVASNCPNDHVIPFRVNMACRNGFDPADTIDYTFQSRFTLVVQRGRELPRIITQDMVLTSDDLWLVPGQTLIQQGVTVTVMEGTQVQWGSPDPNNPYSTPTTSYIQVEGTLLSQGTCNNPVEFFPSPIVAWGANTYIRNKGTTRLSYTKIRNPQLGYGGMYDVLTSIDHCYLDWDSGCWGIGSSAMSNTIVHKVRGGGCGNWGFSPGNLVCCLMDSSWLFTDWGIGVMRDNVFLQDNQNNRPLSWQITGPSFSSEISAALDTRYSQNAFLTKYWDPNVSHWMRISPYYQWNRNQYAGIVSNYWGTTSTTLIDAAITDFNDDFNRAHVVYAPFLTVPAQSTFPFVAGVSLATAGGTNVSIVGAELVTFTVTYNRDMNTNVLPQVTFGPDMPVTDYTVHPIGGGWRDPRTWMGTFNVNPITGDGYQLMRIAGGCAADDPWLVCGEDSGRFRFEIITSGTESMNLQATGSEGKVDLSWMQDDFDLLAGYQLYRSTNPSNSFNRINSTLIPVQVRTFTDTNIQPGRPYYYKFTVVKSDMSESDFSNVAQGTPLDTIPPVLAHTPVTSAQAGLPLTLFADATDNVGVQSVTLFFRDIGEANFLSRAMTRVSGNRWSATLEGSHVMPPGLQYYIETTDGVSTVRSVSPAFPHTVAVSDRPVITAVSPNRGPTAGGTPVTVAGANFRTNLTVLLGGAVAESLVWVSANELHCVTPPHYPAAVDVVVTNHGGASGLLVRGFTYDSDRVTVSLPQTGGAQFDTVQVPIGVANAQGLAAADVTVTFNSTVLRGRGARTGTLTSGWSLTANTNTPGELRLSLASPVGTVTGAGSLALLEFDVVGVPGTNSPLHFSVVSLNGGVIGTDLTDGLFTVAAAYRVAGTVRHWGSNAPLPGVIALLNGAQLFTGVSDSNGVYAVAGVPAGAYTLTPSKTDGVNGISAYDASLVLRHAAGLTNLTGNAAVAADVDKSGAINAMDAFYILQNVVDLLPLPFPGAGEVWAFSPASRSYPSLTANQTGQDFTGILLGDVSGNWSRELALQPQGQSGGQPSGPLRQAAIPAAADIVQPGVPASQSVSPWAWLTENGPAAAYSNGISPLQPGQAVLAVYRTTGGPGANKAHVLLKSRDLDIYSVELKLACGTPSSLIRSGSQAAGMMLAFNTNLTGMVHSALAGAAPIRGFAELLELTLPDWFAGDVTLLEASVNEGQAPVSIVSGTVFDWDSDGDGATDASEIQAGTDPADPKSFFKVEAVEQTVEGGRLLKWKTVAGKTYQVEYKDRLDEAAWHPLAGPRTAAGAEESLVDANAPATQRFYRIRLTE